MADTNFKGAFWGSEVRKRQARNYWPTVAENTDGVDMSSANTVLLLNGEGTNGAQNNTFLDSSTNNFTITRNGNATQGSLSPYSPTGWSAYFDGTGDYLSVASNTQFNLGTGDFTIECWLYVISYPNDFFIVSSTGSGGLFVGFRNSANPKGWGYGRNTIAWDYVSGVLPVENTWQHFAITRSGTSIKMFINGNQIGTTQSSSTSFDLSTTSMTIGSQGATYYYNGYISNLRIVKGTAVYTGNFTPPRLLPLTPYGSNVQYPATANVSSSFTAGNVSFLLRGPQFVDDSVNMFAITRSGDSKIVPFSPYRNYTDTPRSYSAYFDASGDYLQINGNFVMNFGSTNFTVEAWVYLNALPTSDAWPTNWSSHMVLATVGTFNVGDGIGFIIGQTKLLIQTNNDTQYAGTAHGMAVNTWYHLAYVRNGNTFYFYVNGVAKGSAAFSGSAGTGANTFIGCETGQGAFLNGYISNLRIVKGTALYTGNFTPPSAPLLTSGNSTIYASVANVNTTFASANTSLLTLQDANIFDRSSNAFAITAFGNVQPTIQNPFGETLTSNVVYDATVYAGSGYFDGTGDNVTFPTLTLSATAWTIECWVYLTSATISQGLFNFIPHNTIGISLNRTGALDTYVYIGNGSTWVGSPAINSSVNFNRSAWNHIALVRNSGTITLYHNGVAVGTTATMPSGLTGGGTIGALAGSQQGNEPLTGYISNFRIVNGTAVYTNNFAPTITPLSAVANTSLLLNFQNAGVVDRTGKAVIETLGNGQISTSIYKYGNSSMYFDGTGDGLYLRPSPNYGFGSGDFTIEFWIYFNSTASGQNIINGYTTGTTLYNYTIYTGTNTLTYYMSSDGTNWNIANAVNIGSISTSTWYHVALVRSGSTIKPYLNGVAGTATTSSAAIFNSEPPLLIGYYPSSNYVNGYIDDLRITKGQARYDTSLSTITVPTKAFNLI